MKNNPFSSEDKDKYSLWEMLVHRDIEAFVNQDWNLVKNDFHADGFIGVNAQKNENPDNWRLSYPNLDAYKEDWLRQAEGFKNEKWAEDISEALYRVTLLNDIEIKDDTAILHKKFIGFIKKENGETLETNWETLYRCRKIEGHWKIVGFTGYMPLLKSEEKRQVGKSMPDNAVQHETAGPYAPVLVVDPGKLVVISGQAAIDKKGSVIGDTIEEQTAYTLKNCQVQLATAGCTLDDVFKVNVYIKNLDEWPKFNEVYKNYFQDPKPVRTAVQTGLLMNLLVEVELWAVKK